MSLLWIESKIKTYYHASPHEFSPGDRIVPGDDIGKNNFGTTHHRDKVFLHRDYEVSHDWAHTLQEGSGGKPVHVYEVEAPETSRAHQKDSTDGYEYVAPYARVTKKIETLDHDWDMC